MLDAEGFLYGYVCPSNTTHFNKLALYELKFSLWSYFHEFRGVDLTKMSTLYDACSYVYKYCLKHENNNMLTCQICPKTRNYLYVKRLAYTLIINRGWRIFYSVVKFVPKRENICAKILAYTVIINCGWRIFYFVDKDRRIYCARLLVRFRFHPLLMTTQFYHLTQEQSSLMAILVLKTNGSRFGTFLVIKVKFYGMFPC